MTADDWNRKSVYEGVISMLKLCEDVKETNLEVLSDFTNETLEGELADEELGRLLVPTNFTESDGTRTETMRLLDTTSGSGGGSLTSLRLGSELLTRGLA